LGFKPNHNLPAAKVLYLLGADNESLTKCKPAGTTVIYQGKQIFNLVALLLVICCILCAKQCVLYLAISTLKNKIK